MNAPSGLGWRVAFQLLAANVRIGLIVVPLTAIGYGAFVVLRPEPQIDAKVVVALLVGGSYLLVCILRSYRLVRTGVIADVEDLKICRPQDFTLSHLSQVDYSYRYQGSTWRARELLWRVPKSFRTERQYAILDPRKPQRAMLLLVDK